MSASWRFNVRGSARDGADGTAGTLAAFAGFPWTDVCATTGPGATTSNAVAAAMTTAAVAPRRPIFTLVPPALVPLVDVLSIEPRQM